MIPLAKHVVYVNQWSVAERGLIPQDRNLLPLPLLTVGQEAAKPIVKDVLQVAL